MFWWHQKAWLINLIVFDDIKKFFNLDNQVDLPLHPPSYQDSSGLPNYQDTFQVNMIETPCNIWWQLLQHLVRIMTILCRRVVITAVTLQATTAFRHKCSLQGLTRTQLTKTIILSCSQILQPRLHRGGEGRGGKATVEPLPCLQPVPRGADLSGGGGGGGRGGGGGGRGQRALHHLWGTGGALTFLPHLYICYTIHNIPLIL